jgi:hypothetical protein
LKTVNAPASRGDAKTKTLLGLTGLCLVASAAVGVHYFLQGSGAGISTNGFDLAQVEQRKPAPAAAPAAPAASAPASSPSPLVGHMPELDLGGAKKPGAASAAGAQDPAPEADRRREKEFLAKHGAELARYEGRLGRVTRRYYQISPVVRDVDRAFGRMGRYMDVKRRYDQDGNPFEFVRGALGLPEVRGEISRRLSDPQVWKVSVEMIVDTLRNVPPPPAIYSESQHFLTNDPQTSQYLQGFSQEAAAKFPPSVATMPTVVNNIAPIAKLMQDVAPQSAPAPSR